MTLLLCGEENMSTILTHKSFRKPDCFVDLINELIVYGVRDKTGLCFFKYMITNNLKNMY